MSAARFFRRPAVALVLGLCLIGGGISLLSRLATGPSTEPKRVPLSHQAGSETAPAFSPDGQRLAFSARDAAPASPYHLFVRTVDGGAAAQLTFGPANDFGPAWSPDGASVAFLRVDGDRARYMVVPAAGGEPRPVADFAIPTAQPGACRTRSGDVETSDECGTRPGPRPAVSWARDGQSLFVVAWVPAQPPFLAAVPAAGGAPRRITQPPAGSPGDTLPAVSPDGATLAFVRQSPDPEGQAGRSGGDIFLASSSGGDARRLTFDSTAVRGIAWSADGRDLIYAARRLDQDKLWRIAASGGTPRNALASGDRPTFPAVAPAGHRLAFTESDELDWICRIDLSASDPASTARLLFRSSGREYWPSWSPDGKWMADISTANGYSEVWLADADGNHRAPITHLKQQMAQQPRWSPDGRAILFLVGNWGAAELDIVASDGHTAPARTRLPGDSHQASWSHDGKWLYFISMAQVWKAHTDGQQLQKLSNNWGDEDPEESADGQYVCFRRERSIFRVPTAGGAEEEVVSHDPDTRWIAYQPAAKGLYYLERDREERTIALRFFDFQAKQSRELVRLPVADANSVPTFSVSPDGRYLLYPSVDRARTSLVLTENFR